MASLAEKIVAIHHTLGASGLPHAFGGALALAWCTEQARATIDIDVNVFVEPSCAERVVAGLPEDVVATPNDLDELRQEGQARLWWDRNPVDLFLNTTPFHGQAAVRTSDQPFMDDRLPFLSCSDLAVFKAFFNRTKDWADLEAMHAAGSLDAEAVIAVLVEYLGADDDRLDRLRRLRP